MQEILLPVVAGVFIGLAIALVSFKLATRAQIKQATEQGMQSLYTEIVTKRKQQVYQYSDEAKRVME